MPWFLSRRDGSGQLRGDVLALSRDGKATELGRLLRNKDKQPALDVRRNGYTPLHLACQHGHADVCELLLKHMTGKYIDLVNEVVPETQQTPLHVAVHNRNYECIKELFFSKPGSCLKLGMKNCDGKTALEQAKAMKLPAVVRIIRCGEIYQLRLDERKAQRVTGILQDLHREGTNRSTTSAASSDVAEEVAQFLIGKSLLDAAASNNHDMVMNLLQFGLRDEHVLHNSYTLARERGFDDVAATLLLCCHISKHDNKRVHFLLAPSEEVAHTLQSDSELEKERDLVYPRHKSKTIKTWVGLMVAQLYGFMDMCGVILSNMDCNKQAGTVDWQQLQLRLIWDSWLLRDALVCQTSTDRSEHVLAGQWITSLNLRCNAQASVSNAIFHLRNLQELDLSENPLDNDKERSPRLQLARLCAMPKLRVLKLRQIKLSGLPDDVVWARSLTHLDISENRLKDVPSALRTATQLLSLNIANNEQISSVPEFIGHLRRLQELDISGNRLITELPVQMGHLSKLRTLVTHRLSLDTPPQEHQHPASKAVQYLRSRLLGTSSERVFTTVVVGESHEMRSQLVSQLQKTPECGARLLDLGNMDTFCLFMQVLDAKHCNVIIVCDVDNDEPITNAVTCVKFMDKQIRNAIPKPKTATADASAATGQDSPGVGEFEVILAMVSADSAMTYEELHSKATPHLAHFDSLAGNIGIQRYRPLVLLHSREYVQKLACHATAMNAAFQNLHGVPRYQVTLRNRLRAKKRAADVLMQKKLEHIIAQQDYDQEAVGSLLSFLQQDGHLLYLSSSLHGLDKTLFFMPARLFQTLTDTFGPCSQYLQSNPTKGAPGIYPEIILDAATMYGLGDFRSKLRHRYAMQLGAYFGLAYDAPGNRVFLPLWVPKELPRTVCVAMARSLHPPACIHLRLFTAPSGRQPWPIGFFHLLQSSVIDNLSDFTETATTITVEEDGNEVPSVAAASGGDLGIHSRVGNEQQLAGPAQTMDGNEAFPDTYTTLQDLMADGSASFVDSMGEDLSQQVRLTAWRHGIAAWRGHALLFAVFQQSAAPGLLPSVHGLSADSTLCIAVTKCGRQGIRRLSMLIEQVQLLLEKVFGQKSLFPFSQAPEDDSGVEQFAPCQGCLAEAFRNTDSESAAAVAQPCHLYSISAIAEVSRKAFAMAGYDAHLWGCTPY
eukprot:scpid14865/ scgid0751/ Protein flightless-1; Flightless-I